MKFALLFVIIVLSIQHGVQSFSIDPTTFIAQASSAAVAYFGLIAYFDRPQGKLLVDETSLQIKQSQIPNAGLGLYICKSLPEGTPLGAYPGVVRPLQKNINKLMNHPECEAYIWRLSDNSKVIDPTDINGQIQDICYGGSDDTPLSNFFMSNIVKKSVPTTLTRINEPTRGLGGCNVRAVENLEKQEVVFELSRDVYEGEELFMDYGLTYDRSRYAATETDIKT